MRFFPVKYSFLRGGSDTHKPPMVLFTMNERSVAEWLK